MDVRLHEITDRGIDFTMPRERRQPAKSLGNDAHPEVTVTAGSPRMTGMPMTLVLDDKFKGCEACFEPRAQALLPGPRLWVQGAHGSA